MHRYKIIIMLVAVIAITGIASAEVVSTSTQQMTPPIQNGGNQPENMMGNNSQNGDMGMGDGVKADKKGRLMRGGKEVVLTVSSNGDTVLRGVVTAVSSNTLSVKTWGGVWTIDLSKLPSGFQQTDASKIVVGDFVGVNGIMDQTTQIIVAKVARIWDPSKAPLGLGDKGDNRVGTSTNMMPPRRDGENGTTTRMMPPRRDGEFGTSTGIMAPRADGPNGTSTFSGRERQGDGQGDGRRVPPPPLPRN